MKISTETLFQTIVFKGNKNHPQIANELICKSEKSPKKCWSTI